MTRGRSREAMQEVVQSLWPFSRRGFCVAAAAAAAASSAIGAVSCFDAAAGGAYAKPKGRELRWVRKMEAECWTQLAATNTELTRGEETLAPLSLLLIFQPSYLLFIIYLFSVFFLLFYTQTKMFCFRAFTLLHWFYYFPLFFRVLYCIFLRFIVSWKRIILDKKKKVVPMPIIVSHKKFVIAPSYGSFYLYFVLWFQASKLKIHQRLRIFKDGYSSHIFYGIHPIFYLPNNNMTCRCGTLVLTTSDSKWIRVRLKKNGIRWKVISTFKIR